MAVPDFAELCEMRCQCGSCVPAVPTTFSKSYLLQVLENTTFMPASNTFAWWPWLMSKQEATQLWDKTRRSIKQGGFLAWRAVYFNLTFWVETLVRKELRVLKNRLGSRKLWGDCGLFLITLVLHPSPVCLCDVTLIPKFPSLVPTRPFQFPQPKILMIWLSLSTFQPS